MKQREEDNYFKAIEKAPKCIAHFRNTNIIFVGCIKTNQVQITHILLTNKPTPPDLFTSLTIFYGFSKVHSIYGI